MYKKFWKRFFDITLSLLAVIVLALPLLVVAVLVKHDSPGPVLFKQRRIGVNKKEFTILKFRSMSVSAPTDMPTHMLQNADDYLTPFQKAIRKYSIDELPQLFCILCGSMSIVGPRPALWNQYDLIEARDLYGANDIRPGLTGWAQINGRDELPIDVKARFDGEYVKNVSLFFDLKCIFGTVKKVISHEGVVEGAELVSASKQGGSDIENT